MVTIIACSANTQGNKLSVDCVLLLLTSFNKLKKENKTYLHFLVCENTFFQ